MEAILKIFSPLRNNIKRTADNLKEAEWLKKRNQELKSDLDYYRNKCSRYENELKSLKEKNFFDTIGTSEKGTYRNITGSLRFRNLIQTGLTAFYDCTWKFEVSENGGDFKTVSLTLNDSYDKDAVKVLKELIICENLQDIKETDQSKSIYYD